MHHKKKVLLLSMVSLFLVACSGTTDPSKGGLFSYNPSAYEKRLQQREEHLADVESRQDYERKRATSLERENSYTSRHIAQQERQLAALRANIARDRQLLDKALARTNNSNYLKLEQRAADIEYRAAATENEQNLAKRQNYLHELQNEYSNLQRDMQALPE